MAAEDSNNTELRNNNPYFEATLIEYLNGDLSMERDVKLYEESEQDQYHIVVDNDNLTKLAYRFYRDSKLGHVISDANEIFNPFELTTGDTLRIPSIINLDAEIS